MRRMEERGEREDEKEGNEIYRNGLKVLISPESDLETEVRSKSRGPQSGR